MIKVLKFLDLFNIEPTLYLFQESRFKNPFGGVSTIVTLIFIVSFSIYFLIDMLSRRNMSILSNSLIHKTPLINLTTFPLSFGLYTPDGKIINNPQIFNITALYFTTKNINGTVVNKIQDIKIDDCALNETYYGEYLNIFKKRIEGTKCIPIKSFQHEIQGLYGDAINGFSFLVIYINRCVNDSNSQKCESKSVIESALANTILFVSEVDFDIDHESVYNIQVPYLRNDAFPLSYSLFKRYFSYKKNIEYLNDYGFVFQNKEKLEFFQSDLIVADVSLTMGTVYFPTAIGQIYRVNSLKKDTYNRRFPKIQDLLANIGGVIKGLLVINYILVHYCSYKQYVAKIGNKCFQTKGFPKPEKNLNFSNKGNFTDLSSICPKKTLSNNFISSKEINSLQRPGKLDSPNAHFQASTPKKLKLSWKERLTPYFCIKSQTNLILYTKFEIKFIKLMSMENILEKMIDVKNLKKIMLKMINFEVSKKNVS
jgi:hypothetical protein